jgi:hypothetical protein
MKFLNFYFFGIILEFESRDKMLLNEPDLSNSVHIS